jgi:hypothetical protein
LLEGYGEEETLAMLKVVTALQLDTSQFQAGEFFLPILRGAALQGHDAEWVIATARSIVADICSVN